MTQHEPDNAIIINGTWLRMFKLASVLIPILTAGAAWSVNTMIVTQSRVSALELAVPEKLKERLTIVETSAGDPKEWTKLVEDIHYSARMWRKWEESHKGESP